MLNQIVEFINRYGFPIIAAGGMGYFIFYTWGWVTKDIKPVLRETNQVLKGLTERIRLLDSDLIRLDQKVRVVLHLRGKTIERETDEADVIINKEHYIEIEDVITNKEQKPKKPRGN